MASGGFHRLLMGRDMCCAAQWFGSAVSAHLKWLKDWSLWIVCMKIFSKKLKKWFQDNMKWNLLRCVWYILVKISMEHIKALVWQILRNSLKHKVFKNLCLFVVFIHQEALYRKHLNLSRLLNLQCHWWVSFALEDVTISMLGVFVGDQSWMGWIALLCSSLLTEQW